MLRLFLIALACLPVCGDAFAESAKSQKSIRVLLAVGGVGYNTLVIRLLKDMNGIEVVVRNVEDDPVVFTAAALADIDVVAMYHRDNVAEPAERGALLNFLENGGGVVVMHHALANYPDWEHWWRKQVGGLYALPSHEDLQPSRYFYDFRGVARPSSNHPITQRLGAYWRYEDESYSDLWISDDVGVLLETTAFGSSRNLAWIGPTSSNRVVFIQPGHGDSVMTDLKYRNLIEDALRWAARE